MSHSELKTIQVWIGILCMLICHGSTENDAECRDDPLFGSACKNVHNLRAWCDRSRLQDFTEFKNNFAQVCKATCGFCDMNSGKAKPIIESGASRPEDQDVLSVQLGVRRVESDMGMPKTEITTTRPSTPPTTPTTITTTTATTTTRRPTTPPPVPTPPPCGQPPTYTPCLPLDYSNQFFQQCCQDSGIQPACVPLCRYDVKVEQVQLAAAKQQCPFSILPTYFICASRTKNNTDCCRDTGILAETGPQCTLFCDPTSGPYGTLGIKHLKCASYLEDIMRCHWAGLH